MSIPGLQKFEANRLGKLLLLSRIREYEEGEVIIKEGDNDPWLYFLLAGEVRIEKKGVPIQNFVDAGEIFGEMSIIDSQKRSASVYAQTKTILLAVDTAATSRLTSDDERADLLIFLYRIFAEYTTVRLRLTNEQLILAKKEVEELKNSLK